MELSNTRSSLQAARKGLPGTDRHPQALFCSQHHWLELKHCVGHQAETKSTTRSPPKVTVNPCMQVLLTPRYPKKARFTCGLPAVAHRSSSWKAPGSTLTAVRLFNGHELYISCIFESKTCLSLLYFNILFDANVRKLMQRYVSYK